MAVKYKGTSFEDWYKANYGTEYAPNAKSAGISQTEGMSDTDYAIGRKLYDAYLKNNEATATHNETLATLDKDKASAEQAAKVSYMRLQKYLPQQLAKQGLYGTGVTEDAYLKLHNNYMNDVKDIDSNYSDRKTALEQAYRSDMNNREIAAADDVDKVIENQKVSNLENYNEAVSYLEGGSFATAQDVVDALEKYRGKVSDTQYSMLENTAASLIKAYGYDVDGLADGYVKNTVNAGKIYTTRAIDYDSLSSGDNISIKVGGADMEVESDGVAKSSAPAEYAAGNGIKDGELFVFPDDDNAVYMYSGGVAYKIRPLHNTDDERGKFNTLRHYLMYGEVLDSKSVKNTTSSKKTTDNRAKTQEGRGL